MKSLKYGVLLALVVAVSALAASIVIGQNKPAAKGGGGGGEAKVTGEVIDSSCYIKMGAKGSGHAECATNCAKAGIPLAILEDKTDKVIWVSANKDMQGANDMLIPYAGKKVTLTGKWFERGGAKLFAIDRVEPAG